MIGLNMVRVMELALDIRKAAGFTFGVGCFGYIWCHFECKLGLKSPFGCGCGGIGKGSTSGAMGTGNWTASWWKQIQLDPWDCAEGSHGY